MQDITGIIFLIYSQPEYINTPISNEVAVKFCYNKDVNKFNGDNKIRNDGYYFAAPIASERSVQDYINRVRPHIYSQLPQQTQYVQHQQQQQQYVQSL